MVEGHGSARTLLRQSYPAVRERVPSMRHEARAAMESCTSIAPETAYLIEILVSETVTNSVRHSRSDRIRLVIERCAPGIIRVTVTDQGRAAGMPHLSGTGRTMAEGGRGVGLLDGCSRRWGVTREASRDVSVWFELAEDQELGDEVCAAFRTAPDPLGENSAGPSEDGGSDTQRREVISWKGPIPSATGS